MTSTPPRPESPIPGSTPPPECFGGGEDDGSSSSSSESIWWEKDEVVGAKRGEQRWTSLEHNGVLFPPPYEPHGVPIVYDGKEFRMTPEEEEIATFFATMKETPYYRHEVFRRNFFQAWRRVLRKRPEGQNVKLLELCDFEPIWNWWQKQRAVKLNMSREDKKKLKEERDAAEAPYKTCLWDGRREDVANFRVEPPGLFRGRGKHPLMGCLKFRIQPEDVTINIGKDAKVPEPPPGHHWKEVIHDNHVTWLSMWRDTVTESFKYVMMAPQSTVKGMSDREKFEKARRLKSVIEQIQRSYHREFRSESRVERQRAVALYFIDKLALRVGNEKGKDEADTVGCCSLRVEHLKPLPPRKNERDELEFLLHFDFLGKDSIRYVNDVQVEKEVYDLIVSFSKGKDKSEKIFDEVEPDVLNTYLKSFMQDLSAKVFRTYNASKCLEDELRDNPVPSNATVADKLVYFTRANTKVAILCNHQKTVSRGHEIQVSQISERMQYMADHVDRMERIKEIARKRGTQVALEEFFKEEDELQLQWLEKYGKPEELEAYKEHLASRRTRGTGGNLRQKKERPAKRERDVKQEQGDERDAVLNRPPKRARKEGKKDEAHVKAEEAHVKAEEAHVKAEGAARRSRAAKAEKAAIEVAGWTDGGNGEESTKSAPATKGKSAKEEEKEAPAVGRSKSQAKRKPPEAAAAPLEDLKVDELKELRAAAAKSPTKSTRRKPQKAPSPPEEEEVEKAPTKQARKAAKQVTKEEQEEPPSKTRAAAKNEEEKGAETPMKKGAETPMKKGAETPMKKGAETPMKKGAETPMKKGAETPMKKGARPKKEPPAKADGNVPEQENEQRPRAKTPKGAVETTLAAVKIELPQEDQQKAPRRHEKEEVEEEEAKPEGKTPRSTTKKRAQNSVQQEAEAAAKTPRTARGKTKPEEDAVQEPPQKSRRTSESAAAPSPRGGTKKRQR